MPAIPQWGDGVIVTLAIGTAILFFVSLLLHELAHSLVATSNQLPVKEITLFALGGVSQIEKNPTSAKVEFWMAFVGPLTSAVIGASCLALAHAIGDPKSDPWMAMLLWLGYINLMLAGFNLLPGYPLDGGRVLRALIWWKTGNADRSTQTAARVGQVVAFGFIAFGIVQFFGGAGINGLWTAFIGWFLLQAARESYVQVGLAHALEGVRVSDVMTKDCPTVDGWLNLQNFVDQELLRTGQRCFMVVEKGEIKGLVTPHEVKQVERAKWPFTTLADIMRPLEDLQSVTPDAPLDQRPRSDEPPRSQPASRDRRRPIERRAVTSSGSRLSADARGIAGFQRSAAAGWGLNPLPAVMQIDALETLVLKR